MNLYPSKSKINASTDVYIDGQEISANRVEITSLISLPSDIGIAQNELISCEYDGTICLAYNSYTVSFLTDDGWESSEIAIETRPQYSTIISYQGELNHFQLSNVNSYIYNSVYNGETFVQRYDYGFNPFDVTTVTKCNNELYALLKDYNHVTLRKISNGSCVDVVDLPLPSPYSYYKYTKIAELNNEIHIFGGKTNDIKPTWTLHKKWNGVTLSDASSPPNDAYMGRVVTYNNKIHLIKDFSHYSWDGTQWKKERDNLFYHNVSFNSFVCNDSLVSVGVKGKLVIETYKEISDIKDVTIIK